MLKHKLSNFFMQGLVIGLITLALSFNAQGAEDPWLHLEKASQAARKLSYKGIFLSKFPRYSLNRNHPSE